LRIVFLGPDGAGKSSVIAGLVHRFEQAGRVVKMRHLKPRLIAQWRGQPDLIVVDPHGKPPRSAFLSIVKIAVWVFEEWYARLFEEPRGTLLICDRYYHDLLVDPKRFRFGAPLWMAKIVGAWMPRPELWILLDAPPDVLQARKQEVAAAETARQCQAYRDFVRTRRDHVIVDATQPMDHVIEQAECAIKQTLRTDGFGLG